MNVSNRGTLERAASDADLLAAWSRGDRSAGGALIGRHLPTLRRFLRARASDAADELVQRTVTACAEHLGRFRGEATFEAYLLGIARNQLHTHYRENRRHEVSGLPALAEEAAPCPFEAVADRERTAALARALRGLSTATRLAFELHYWQGLVPPEIAEELGEPIDTVYARLRRGKAKLRLLMSTEPPLSVC